MLTRSKTKGKTGTRWKRRGRKRGDVNSNRRRSPHLRASTIIDSPRSLRKVQATDNFSASINYDPDQPRDEDGKWADGGGSSADHLVSAHVLQSGMTGEQRHELASLSQKVKTARSSLIRVSREDRKHAVGDAVSFDEPTSFSGSVDKILSGAAAGQIAWKSSDAALYVVENPSRGLDVDYSKVGGKFSAVGENETIVAGAYKVSRVEYVTEPGTNPSYGYKIKKYVLTENRVTDNTARRNGNSRPNPLRVDPTRTSGVRRRFSADIRRRLAALGAAIRRFLVTDDELGLVTNVFCPTGEGGGVDPSCSPSIAIDLANDRLDEIAAVPEVVKGVPTGSIPSRSVFASEVSKVAADKPRPPYDHNRVVVEKRAQPVVEEHVDLSMIVTTQDTLSRELVHDYVGGKKSKEPIVVVRSGGRDYLEDGNHRAAAAILRGEKSIKARIIRMPVVAANAFCPTGPGGGQDNSCSPNTVKKYNVRFDDIIQEHMDEIKILVPEVGILSAEEYDKLPPVILHPTPGGKNYVIDGFHRLAGLLKFGHTGSVKAVVVKDSTLAEQAFGRGKDAEEARKTIYSLIRNNWLIKPDGHVPRSHGGFGGQDNAANAQTFRFSSSPEKLAAFRRWLQAQMKLQGLLFTEQRTEERGWWEKYIREVWQQGQARAYDDVNRSKKVKSEMRDYYKDYAEREPGGKYKTAEGGYKTEKSTDDFYAYGKEQFLRDSFQRPVSVERVQQMASRTFTDLKGFSDDMATRINRTLTDGLIKGQSPRETAKEIADQLDISEARALTIARTETVRALNEGALDAMENLGVARIGVAVEWSVSGLGETALGNLSPCPVCAPLEGTVWKIEEAHGKLPRHPNCMCTFIPANVGEDGEDQIDTQGGIERAIRASLEEEGGAEKSSWGGAEAEIDEARPQSIFNVYDPDQERDEQGRWSSSGGANFEKYSDVFEGQYGSDPKDDSTREAFRRYLHGGVGGFKSMNAELRAGGRPKEVDLLMAVAKPFSKINESLDNDGVVYRGVTNLKALGLDKGDSFVELGLMSTSTDPVEAGNFATQRGGRIKNAVMRIKPDGDVLAFVGAPGQREVVLEPGTRLTVTGRRVGKFEGDYTKRDVVILEATASKARIDNVDSLAAFSEAMAMINAGDNCGIGPDGFEPGNTCAKGGEGVSVGDSASYRGEPVRVVMWVSKNFVMVRSDDWGDKKVRTSEVLRAGGQPNVKETAGLSAAPIHSSFAERYEKAAGGDDPTLALGGDASAGYKAMQEEATTRQAEWIDAGSREDKMTATLARNWTNSDDVKMGKIYDDPKYVKHIRDAAVKNEKDLYRGLDFDKLDDETISRLSKAKPGDALPEMKIASFTEDQGWAEHFSGMEGVVLKMPKGGGKSLGIQHVSNSVGEREHVVSGQYRVKSVEDGIIEMEESSMASNERFAPNDVEHPLDGGLLGEGEDPRGISTNAFCPTGPGGGVDPTCSPGGGW